MTRPPPPRRAARAGAPPRGRAPAGAGRAPAARPTPSRARSSPSPGSSTARPAGFELTPTFDLSFNDAFYKKYFGGLKVGYHFTEFLSVGATFAMAARTAATGSAVVCPANQGCHAGLAGAALAGARGHPA